MSVIENILEQYRERKSHVQVLGASIRSVDHIYACLQKDIDSMTIPFNVIEKFISHGFAVPENFSYQCSDNNLESIPYTAHASEKWEEYNIQHDLTDTGLQKFADDWNALLK
jgi:transaldolase